MTTFPVLLIKQVPAWSGNQTQRAIGTSKLAFVDTGIAPICWARTPPGSGNRTGRREQ